MELNYLALAIPLFTLLMLLEFLAAGSKRKKIFQFPRSMANINVGIAERLLDTFITGSVFFLYDFLHRNYAFFEIKASLVGWITLLICTDFVWYWYHRLAHRINIFWAAHIVHHQSEDFNYTVSARITVFQAIIRTGFWAVLPVIGFPAAMVTSVLLVHGLYPFLIHTQLVGRLGILEYILVTPSHHRVHHASNPEYLDKNFGDVFIIWDKLFGTFRKEETAIVYGLTKPLKSNSFLWQHFHFIIELLIAARRQKGWLNKLRVLFGKPESVDPGIRDNAEKIFHIRSNEQPDNPKLNKYVLAQVGATLLLLFLFIFFEHYFDWQAQLLFTLIVLLTLINCGAILEQRRWIFYLEYVRLFLLLAGVLWFYPAIPLILTVLLLLPLSIVYFERLRNRYLNWVYQIAASESIA